MSGHNTKKFIEINGKRYDAVSGALLGDIQSINTGTPENHGSKHQTIDGFTRVSRGVALSAKLHTHASQPVHAANKPAAPRTPHAKAGHVAAHAPQKAITLMRTAVKKPDIKSPKVIKAHQRTDLLATIPVQTVAPKLSYQTVNKVRLNRAVRLIKSPIVRHYSQSTFEGVTPTIDSSVRPAIAAPPARHLPHRPTSRSGPSAGRSLSGVTAAPAVHHMDVRPAAIHPTATDKKDIFEQALAAATSHEQTYDQPEKEHSKRRTKRRGKIFRAGAATLIAVIMLSLIAYHNTPKLSLAVASYKAGLHAKLPAESPEGYSFGYLNYRPGNVTVNFTSVKDSHQFNITQKASSWDSQALLSNFVASANNAYRTYQRAGRTIYVLGNNTATWVDSGIWYTVDGNSSLSSDQLLALAGSM